MNEGFEPALRGYPVVFSNRLNRSLSCISCVSFVELNVQSNSIVLTSQKVSEGLLVYPRLSPGVMRAPGDLVGCEELPCDQGASLGRAAIGGLSVVRADTAGQSWHIFRMTFAAGVEDRISVLIRDGNQKVAARGLLATIWPVLREDCLHDLSAQESEVGDEALLWMIASRINMSILVMNKDGRMLRANAAAKLLLDQETVLRRTPKGIRCINDSQTRAFHNALSKCARSDPLDGDQIMFLDTATAGMRVPVTLSRFHHMGAATELVLVSMPLPPESRRVEMLARAIGLTPAEARIAALLQMGLSNKDAAIAAGLKEQSVSTYAKRILNKLNVTSRAEMAQMLTWQAGGGQLS